jgi:hypothetical protein
VKVDDTSEERKTADKLLEHLEAAMKEVEEKWGAKVVAIVTDASGGSVEKRDGFLDGSTRGLWYLIVIHTRCDCHLAFAQYLFILFSRKLDQSRSWKVLQVQCGCFEIFRQGNKTHHMASQQDSRSCYDP